MPALMPEGHVAVGGDILKSKNCSFLLSDLTEDEHISHL